MCRKVGYSLKTLRKAKGLTQAELADRLGKPQSYISKLETGERGLYLYEVIPLSKALGESTHTIIDAIEAALSN